MSFDARLFHSKTGLPNCSAVRPIRTLEILEPAHRRCSHDDRITPTRSTWYSADRVLRGRSPSSEKVRRKVTARQSFSCNPVTSCASDRFDSAGFHVIVRHFSPIFIQPRRTPCVSTVDAHRFGPDGALLHRGLRNLIIGH